MYTYICGAYIYIYTCVQDAVAVTIMEASTNHAPMLCWLSHLSCDEHGHQCMQEAKTCAWRHSSLEATHVLQSVSSHVSHCKKRALKKRPPLRTLAAAIPNLAIE